MMSVNMNHEQKAHGQGYVWQGVARPIDDVPRVHPEGCRLAPERAVIQVGRPAVLKATTAAGSNVGTACHVGFAPGVDV